jgi:hypothetical protein
MSAERPMQAARRALAEMQAKASAPPPPPRNLHAPRGKVPRGIMGLVKKTGGVLHAQRAGTWEAEQRRDVRGWLMGSPAWALSMAFHLLAAVVLMNVVYFARRGSISQIFRVTLSAAAPGGLQQGDQDNGINGKDNEDAPPAGPIDPDAPPGNVNVPAEPVAAPLPLSVDVGPSGGGEGPGGIYTGRGGEGRGDMLRRFGGDGVSEQAVADGLAWLAAHQDADGSWDPAGYSRHCPKNDVCADGRPDGYFGYFDGYRSAITGCVLLAFLGAGYTHQDRQMHPDPGAGPSSNPFAGTVDRALQYLTRRQRTDGGLVSGEREMERALYSHGMAAFALVEAYSLTKDPRLKPHAQLAVAFSVAYQQDTGGWDYGILKTGRSDTSITSWHVMIMRSARAAGLVVPKRAWERVRGFMEAVLDPRKGTIGYEIEPPNMQVGPGCNAMVASGWLSRMYLGMPDDHQLQGKFAETLLKSPPRFDNQWGRCNHWSMLRDGPGHTHWSLYYTYYATLALFHHGGDAWEKWNTLMRECTLKTQKKDRHAKGSWDPVTSDAAWGGRTYATAMNVINLEVYYRYLPCYQVGAEFGLSPLASKQEWDETAKTIAKGTFHVRPGAKSTDPAAPAAERTKEALLEDLKSADMMTRRNAAKELAARHDAATIPAMIAAALGEKTSLKPVLVEYLGEFGEDERILDFLIEQLASTVPRIKSAASDALAKATGTDIGPYPTEWREWRRKRALEQKGKK